MKVEIECASCIIHRAYLEIADATKDPKLQFKAISEILEFMRNEFNPAGVPAYLGTKRDRIIKKVTGNPDPYAEKKRLSNKMALELLPIAKKMILENSSSALRFRKACLCAIVGNVMEFDIPQHRFEFGELRELINFAEQELVIDDIAEIFHQAKNARMVVYLTDNAGEIAFDKLLVEELKNLGCYVTVAVKGGAILNDATIEDAKFVGIQKVADEVITTGTDAVGLCLKECSKEFIDIYRSADLVVAKGMGYAETLTEINLNQPHALLMRTKCNPVARFFGVKKGRNVAKLMF